MITTSNLNLSAIVIESSNSNDSYDFMIDGSLSNNSKLLAVNISGIIIGSTSTGQPYHHNINETRHSDIINNIFIQSAFYVIYATIFVLGIFGNVLVCYVVLRNRAMQTVTNLFITNLALSDILLCVLAVPFTPLYTFLRRWVFGTLLCHLVPYAQGCSVYISTLTLTSIAIDRFFVIIFPFHPRMKLSTCLSIIISIWIISLLITLPYGFYVRLYASNFTGADTLYCEEAWEDEYYRKVFGSITSMLQFLLPFLIISFCYICVSIRLNDRAKSKPGSKTSRKEETDRNRKKRTNIMLISMVGVFGLSWLPLNIVNIINDFYSRIDEWRYYTLLFFIAHSIAMSSTCYNPFLYAWLNDNFRKEFKQVLPFFNDFINGRSNQYNSSGGRSERYRSERTCNGNNETIQETLLPSSVMRPSLNDILMKNNENNQSIEFDISPSYSNNTGKNPTICDNDIILLSDVVPSKKSPETIILPSGVLETPFENNFSYQNNTANLSNNNNNNNSSNSNNKINNGCHEPPPPQQQQQHQQKSNQKSSKDKSSAVC